MSILATESLYHTEFIDGREVQKPLPKKLHALIQKFMLLALNRELPDAYEVLPELNVLCGQDRLVPDLTVARRDARYLEGDLADPATFTVEILSPGQSLPDLIGKADRIVRAGAPMCWVIWGEARRAWMYTLTDLEEARGVISAPLAGDNRVEINLDELWPQLDQTGRQT
ncbi:MAG TPA: Uma2 family endonuclease [Bryobacteraceae bacterium]|nr:Uma2 family endonuclease [Bryobacteraceae bacterium]